MKIFLLIADLGNTALFQRKTPGSLSSPFSERVFIKDWKVYRFEKQ